MQDLLISIIVGLVIGAIFATVILFAMRKTNKNVKFQYGASNYIRNNSFYIDNRKEIYLYRRVSKTRRSSK
jgi:hypothetical protein